MNKSPFNTLGGVTPLKKGEKGSGSGKSQTRKQRAGKVGKRATATRAQDKSGYSRSGADFINVHSFTANTRLSPSLANTLGPSISSAVMGKNNQSKNKTDKNQIGVDADGNPIFLPDGYTVETMKVPGEEGGKGNEFADNCYNADGSRKEGHTYYSEIKGMDIACEWGGESDGSFDYEKQGTEDSYKTVIKDKDGNEIGSYDNEGQFEGVLNIEKAKQE